MRPKGIELIKWQPKTIQFLKNLFLYKQ